MNNFNSFSQNSIYNYSYFVNKFINRFVKHGKKKIVERNVYLAFLALKPKNAAFILLKSIWILKPFVNLRKRSKLIGKKKRKQITFVASSISSPQQYKLAISWLINFIIIQKKNRRKHNYKSLVKLLEPIRGMSKSKKKTFDNRFHIAYAHQQLNDLITNKFNELDNTKYIQLIRKKLHLYVAVTNNRINRRFKF